MTDLEIYMRIAEFADEHASPTIGEGYAFVDPTPVRMLAGLDQLEFPLYLEFMQKKGIIEFEPRPPYRLRLTELGNELHLENKLQRYLRTDDLKPDRSDAMDEGYDVAQICLNGHIITERAKSAPDFKKAHCPRCGQSTVTECPKCKSPIQGHYHVPGVISVGRKRSPAPRYCHGCGAPFPWTETALNAAKELALSLGLPEQEAENLAASIPDLVSEGPRTPVAVQRMKTGLAKAGGQAAEFMSKVLANVISESIKIQLFGP